MSRFTPAALVLVAALLCGCGGGSGSTAGTGPGTSQTREPAPAAVRVPPLKGREISVEHLRRAVLQGLGRDFLGGTQVGPPSYGLCLQRGVRRLLDERTLRSLALIYRRPAGQQFTAQALTDLAAPVGTRCAHGRRLVPTLIAASEAFRSGRLPEVGIGSRLTYGPYLGVRCARPSSTLCERVGIDLVLRRKAAAVTAWIGGRRLRLRTPGWHTGVPGHDWVSSLDNVGFDRKGSPFRLPGNARRRASWAGYPGVYVPVKLEVAYADGERVAGILPRVFLSPGWG